VERKEKIIVGVNEHVMDEKPHPILYIDEQVAGEQVERVRTLRQRRDHARVTRALADLSAAARGTDNLMPPILEASRAYATVGEMCDALRDVFGEYHEQPIF
jgi:methylmalonyl-CoA mutase N-terminal domain/subunit